jgi:hypothetical protein
MSEIKGAVEARATLCPLCPRHPPYGSRVLLSDPIADETGPT